MTERDTEVLVVGGGPGGYTAAIRVGQLGCDVTLVERNAYGGTCLNAGCIPSKALITVANRVHEVRNGDRMGIEADVDLDFGTMMDWKDDVVSSMSRSVEKLCRANRVSLLEGRAEFVDDHTARIVDENGSEVERTTFDHAIIATGSRPIELPEFEFDRPAVLDAGQALELQTLPDQLVVVGAGYIGMELSTMFAKLGVEVTVLEALDTMLQGFPANLVAPVDGRVTELGIDVHCGERATACETTDKGITVRTESDDGTVTEYPADAVLVAVGRQPVADTVAPEQVGLELDDRGFIRTDEHCRTARDHIFAVGDVAGEPMLAHAGSAEAEVAAERIAGRAASMNNRAIPAVAFTDPEIATVGLSAEEARDTAIDVSVGEFPMRASGRALTTGHTDGFVRLVADEDGTVLGGQAVGPEASELVAEIGLAVERGLTVTDLTETVHAHPTLAEAIREAAANVEDRAIHTLNR
ncbi:dihydrolipoyl dehydrogenase [Halobellus marinus]|uniref:dihydrolipoyl dehydrogenase n=1 Tax=Halobellus TaxID=1073986 RepID=UPI0028AB35D6|nr:dihydrolipoyl dehydrogenase [Halobellus sp. DFY28]